jgi:hypothetical protein
MAKRRHIGGLILSLALAGPLAAQPPTTAVIGTPPQPGWSQLGAQQKTVLAPLAGEWDKMENIRRKKWLGIAERYPTMSQDEQRRMQERMREWAGLTPEQRAKARDIYKDFNQLPTEQKQAVKQKWEAYSNLPPEEKQRVRQEGKSSRLLTPPAAETTPSLETQAPQEPIAADAPASSAPQAAPEAGKN